jgi:hypothetical protein
MWEEGRVEVKPECSGRQVISYNENKEIIISITFEQKIG